MEVWCRCILSELDRCVVWVCLCVEEVRQVCGIGGTGVKKKQAERVCGKCSAGI